MSEPAESHALIALRPGDRIGAYKILSLLGQGGMGAVFLARHERLDRDVAIKVLRPDSDPTQSSIERFVREAKAAAAIRHPHVVDVYDVGAEQGALYMVMERLHGDTLADVLEGRKKLSIEETLDVILPILDALDMVHDEGIVHRDVKPENIFIVRGRRRLFPKLLDFGISKVRVGDGQKLTGASALMGTPAYMAPEQVLEAREVDRRADLYSVCAVIFECVTGQRPFKSRAVFDLLRQVVDEPAPRASSIEPSLPPGLDEILARGLAKKPEDRFASAEDMSRALVRFAGAEARVLWAREEPTVRTARDGTGVSTPAPLALSKSIPLGRSGVAAIDAETAAVIDEMLAKMPTKLASVSPEPGTPAPAQARPTRSTQKYAVVGAVALSLVAVVAVAVGARASLRPTAANPTPVATPNVARAATSPPSNARQAPPSVAQQALPSPRVEPEVSAAPRPAAAPSEAHIHSTGVANAGASSPAPSVAPHAGTRATHGAASRQDAGHRAVRPHESVYAID
ncbi:MAG: protein kinase [Myxococcales bacterium]|nr:protein kinase [Myxococcales bacterium]